jgi:hypothetical protein
MDRAVNSAAAKQGAVGGVNDRVNGQSGYISLYQLDIHIITAFRILAE